MCGNDCSKPDVYRGEENENGQRNGKTFIKPPKGDQGYYGNEKNRQQVKGEDSLKNLNFLVGKIVSIFQNEDGIKFNKFSTGCIISPKLIITVAHAVFHAMILKDQTYKIIEAIQVYFIPNFANSLNNPSPNNKQIKVINKFYMNKYKQSMGHTHDIAFLQLQHNLILQGLVGAKPNYEFFNTFQKQKKVKINIVGYFVEKDKKQQIQEANLILYGQEQLAYKNNREQKYQIYYQHTTSQGTSGAPIFYRQKQSLTYKLVGIHKGQLQHFSCNYGTLINIFCQQHTQFFNQKLKSLLPIEWTIGLSRGSNDDSDKQKLNQKDVTNLFEKGYKKFQINQYDQALINYNEVINMLRKLGKEDSLDMASIISKIGQVYYHKSQFNDAISKYNECLQICRKNQKLDSFPACIAYNDLGVIYEIELRFDQALENYKKSIQIRKKLEKKDSQNIATAFHNMGTIYQRQREYEKALEHLNKSVEIMKNLGKENSVVTARTIKSIGIVYQNQFMYDQALEYHRKSLEILSKISKQHTQQYGGAISNIGTIYYYQKNDEKALIQLNKALQIFQKIRKMNSIEVSNIHFLIATIYLNKKEFKRSQQHYNKCFNIQLSILGIGHPVVKNTKQILQIVRQQIK